MKRIALVAVLALALAVGLATAGAGQAKTTGAQAGQKNLVQTAIAAGQFKTLAALLTKAGLAKVPKATLAALGNNKAKLRAVLLYHVVKGRVPASQAMMLKSAKTLEGKSLSIRVVNGKVIVGGATVVKADVMATNGVIHVINKVLVP
jgi:uncharacterized surface protein with fasciclin (FAS1) repeats